MAAFPMMPVCLLVPPTRIVPMARCAERALVWIVWMIGIARLGRFALLTPAFRGAAVIFRRGVHHWTIVPKPTARQRGRFVPNEGRMVVPADSVRPMPIVLTMASVIPVSTMNVRRLAVLGVRAKKECATSKQVDVSSV